MHAAASAPGSSAPALISWRSIWVRAGDWKALLRPHGTKKRASLYRATVRVPADPGTIYLQPIHLQDKLPEIHIPLRRDDPKLTLALQPLLDRAYENGRYARRIDYHRDPDPPLDTNDAVWTDPAPPRCATKVAASEATLR